MENKTIKNVRHPFSCRCIAASLAYLDEEHWEHPRSCLVASIADLNSHAYLKYDLDDDETAQYVYVGRHMLSTPKFRSKKAEKDCLRNGNFPAGFEVHSILKPFINGTADFNVFQLYEMVFLFYDVDINNIKEGSAQDIFIKMVKSGEVNPLTSDTASISFAVYLATVTAKGEAPTVRGFSEHRSMVEDGKSVILSGYRQY